MENSSSSQNGEESLLNPGGAESLVPLTGIMLNKASPQLHHLLQLCASGSSQQLALNFLFLIRDVSVSPYKSILCSFWMHNLLSSFCCPVCSVPSVSKLVRPCYLLFLCVAESHFFLLFSPLVLLSLGRGHTTFIRQRR